MPALALGNTVYTHPMAKVMISIPDDLLSRIDALAGSSQETRSGFLRRLAERELGSAADRRSTEIAKLLKMATGPKGGDAAKLIREDRESH
jgi:metal-responsive CopG/Arc/MetJ family transcriptional regulator